MCYQYVYIATGSDMQGKYDTFNEARQAADYAPWADGRVYCHNRINFCGSGENGGVQVYPEN